MLHHHSGRVLCTLCFTGYLKKNEKNLKKYLILNISKNSIALEKLLLWIQKGTCTCWLVKRGKMAYKACKGTFFEEIFLIPEKKEAATVASVFNNTDENTTIEDTTSIHFIHKSNCKLTQYKSSLDNSSCIIWNEIKYEKGRKVSLLSTTLKKHRKENHQAEETLTKFANIHIQNDTKYKDAAQRIILPQNLSYHKYWYKSFHSPYCERKSKSDKIIHDD